MVIIRWLKFYKIKCQKARFFKNKIYLFNLSYKLFLIITLTWKFFCPAIPYFHIFSKIIIVILINK